MKRKLQILPHLRPVMCQEKIDSLYYYFDNDLVDAFFKGVKHD